MNVEWLEGPVFASYWVKGGRRFWLYGDLHEINADCTKTCLKGRLARIEQVIAESAATLYPDKLHILLEVPPWKNKKPLVAKVGSYIDLVGLFLLGCRRTNTNCKQACYYPNVEVHPLDARKMLMAFNGVCEAAYRMDTRIRNHAKALASIPKEHVAPCVGFMESYRACETMKDIYMRVMNETGSIDQIKAVRNKADRDIIYEQIVNHMFQDDDFFHMGVQEVTRALRSFVQNKPSASDTRVLYEFFAGWQRTAEGVMDAYASGRMFRDFDSMKSLDNVIVFAGYVHTETYKRLLSKMGFTCKWQTPEEKKPMHQRKLTQCHDMRGAPSVTFKR
jgi:hypothetical protein